MSKELCAKVNMQMRGATYVLDDYWKNIGGKKESTHHRTTEQTQLLAFCYSIKTTNQLALLGNLQEAC